jgi:octaheme c-type cytochrome (tetrathionate reductase family)
MHKLTYLFLLIVIPNVIGISFINFKRVAAPKPVIASDDPELNMPSVYHSKFKELDKEFSHENPQEITAICLTCHTERGKEVMRGAHWRWSRESYVEARDSVLDIGKKNLLNNFCIGIAGSEGSCNRCHIGYGWKDNTFDFSDQNKIDCLICHDNTGTYEKETGMAGYPSKDVDLKHVAQNVGKPKKENCAYCHANSAGGNNFKRGSLDNAMLDCTRELDVHMAKDGPDMNCIDCHTAEKHKMKGRYYGLSSTNENRIDCIGCHTQQVHAQNILNEHTIKISCQVCHIPEYAKANATKMYWDWSAAGNLRNGEPYHEEDEDGNHTYLSIKGAFVFEKNVEPEYIWFNGTADHYLLGDQVDTSKPILINKLFGAYNDQEAKIYPVKIHRARQPYDCTHKMLIQPKLWDARKGAGAYWTDFNWYVASKEGMEKTGLSFSGKYCFVNTEMYLPVNHMVAPKEQALDCKDCHVRKGGRLDALQDFYMPGRNYNASLDFFGKWIIILSFLGAAFHALLRFYSYRNKKNTHA